MTSDAIDASAGMRAASVTGGLALLAAGGFTLFSTVNVLIGWASAATDTTNALAFTNRDMLYVVVWAVFSASLIFAGLSLVHAAFVARRQNLVPGPTLYVAGVSAVVIGLFMIAGGALVPAFLALAVGVALMAAEYGSDTI